MVDIDKRYYIGGIIVIIVLVIFLIFNTNIFCFISKGVDCGALKPNLDHVGKLDEDRQYLVSEDCYNLLESVSDDKQITKDELKTCIRDRVRCGEKYEGDAVISIDNGIVKFTGCEPKPCVCPNGSATGAGEDCMEPGHIQCLEGGCNTNYTYNPETKNCDTMKCELFTQEYLDQEHENYQINVEECAATYDEWAQDNFYYNSDNPPTINSCLTCKDSENTSGNPIATCTADGSWTFEGCGHINCTCDNGTPIGTVGAGDCTEDNLNNCDSCDAGYSLSGNSCLRHCPSITADMLPEEYMFLDGEPSNQCSVDTGGILHDPNSPLNNILPETCNLTCREETLNSNGPKSAECVLDGGVYRWTNFTGCDNNNCPEGQTKCLRNYNLDPIEYHEGCHDNCSSLPAEEGGLPGDNECRIQFDSGEYLKLGPYVEYPTLGDGNSTTGWCSINVSENDFENLITENNSCTYATDDTLEGGPPFIVRPQIQSPERFNFDAKLIFVDNTTPEESRVLIYNDDACLESFMDMLKNNQISQTTSENKKIYYKFSDQESFINQP